LAWGLFGVFVTVDLSIVLWRRNERLRIEAALKQEMLQRGMSADDIVRVIQASQATASRIHSENAIPQKTATPKN
jgi:hypothetical protein